MINSVEEFFTDGCGRCKWFKTDKCKVHKWHNELKFLRNKLKNTALKEELKWSQPCYTIDGKNKIILSSLKDCCTLSFQEGYALNNKYGLLEKPGPNSNIGRVIKIPSMAFIFEHEKEIDFYINEAINVTQETLKSKLPKAEGPSINEELANFFKNDSAFEKAFYSLTPGKQKGYLIHFNSAKQSKTRINRIEKYYDKIMNKKGFHD